MACPIRIGLISDTHNLLRVEAARAMVGSAQIIHAGDICGPDVLDELRRIAPVTAVRGNNDRGAWAETLPESTLLHIEDIHILVIHDLATLAVDPIAEGIRVIVAGHSHRPCIDERDGVLYVNPGSAGPRRFRLPVCVGELWIRGRAVEPRLNELHIA